jgi:hypothetical protein
MPRQFARDDSLRAVVDEILLLVQERGYSALQLLDIARELERAGTLRLIDERLEEQLIRREAFPRRGGHKAQGR